LRAHSSRTYHTSYLVRIPRPAPSFHAAFRPHLAVTPWRFPGPSAPRTPGQTTFTPEPDHRHGTHRCASPAATKRLAGAGACWPARDDLRRTPFGLGLHHRRTPVRARSRNSGFLAISLVVARRGCNNLGQDCCSLASSTYTGLGSESVTSNKSMSLVSEYLRIILP
jgi:hypothetical protein